MPASAQPTADRLRIGDRLNLSAAYRLAAHRGHVAQPDAQAYARARRSLRQIRQDPGDLAGLDFVPEGIAIAEADRGRGPGWIPDVQRVGCAIADELAAAA